MLTKLGQRGYAVHEDHGEYRTGEIDPDTDTDTDPDPDFIRFLCLSLSPKTPEIKGPVRRVRAPCWVPWILLFDPVSVWIDRT